MTNYDDIPILAGDSPVLVSPAGGILGALNLGTLSNSNGVISSDTAHYSEVGAILLKMSDEDFAGIDAADGTSLLNRTISSPEIIIGRFIPDHFEATTVNNGSFDDTCAGFTYSGQAFTYQTTPELKITAYNSFSAITQNYTDSFAKLTPSNFSVTTPTSDAVRLQANNIDLISLNWNPAASSLNDNTDGSLNFTFGADSFNHFHDANSLVAPYTNIVNLSFTAITDSDGVTTQALPHILQPIGGSVRFGRIAINNAHGSELTPLTVAIKTEYFNGIDWTNNTADQCTALILASQLQISNPETGGGSWLAGTTTMTIASGTTAGTLTNNNPLTNGSAILSLSAPGEDNQGYVNIRSQISGSYNWLLGDYNGNGIYDNEATARASFGLFKGSDTIIFRREIY
jgi:MSHA biogenesis protein MshQ